MVFQEECGQDEDGKERKADKDRRRPPGDGRIRKDIRDDRRPCKKHKADKSDDQGADGVHQASGLARLSMETAATGPAHDGRHDKAGDRPLEQSAPPCFIRHDSLRIDRRLSGINGNLQNPGAICIRCDFGYFPLEVMATRADRAHLQETRLGRLMMPAVGQECAESIDIPGT